LYDLPAGGNKKGRWRDPRNTLLTAPLFVNRSTARLSEYASLLSSEMFTENLRSFFCCSDWSKVANAKANASGFTCTGP